MQGNIQAQPLLYDLGHFVQIYRHTQFTPLLTYHQVYETAGDKTYGKEDYQCHNKQGRYNKNQPSNNIRSHRLS